MKRRWLIAPLGLLSWQTNAQVEVDGNSLNEIDITYIELIGRTKFLNPFKLKIIVDYGQKLSWNQQTIRNENGNNQSFNSMVDALNFMEKNGWEYVSNYLVTSGDEQTYRYLLRRKEVAE